MSRYVLWLVFGLIVTAVGLMPVSAETACDRNCLRTMLDQYLTAVVKHDPSAAPLVVGFRQTENAINVRPGNGVWKTVTALGKVQRRYLDPVSRQAAYYGTVEEGSNTAIVTVRVHVENRQLTEAEWYLARADDSGRDGRQRQPGSPPVNLHNPEYLANNPPPDRVVPRNLRSDRATLLRIVDSYFDAMTSHDASVALTQPGCGRVDNGTPAPAGRFLPPLATPGQPPAEQTAPGTSSGDCVGNFAKYNLQMAVGRRIPIVDVEAQVVLAYAVFIRRAASPIRRKVLSEWFVIEEARIRTIYTAMFYPPPELAVPNWPPYDGNWPQPSAIVPAPSQPR
jgi:hypothetical protein